MIETNNKSSETPKPKVENQKQAEVNKVFSAVKKNLG